MPNTGRITLCPFYRDEKNMSISCEDTVRTFAFRKKKNEWMDRYCDLEWKACPYAAALLKMYDDIEKGDAMAEERHKYEAIDKELRKVKSMLGKALRRVENRDETIRDLRKKNRILEERYNIIRKDYDEQRKRAEILNEKLFHALPAYEARFCYLMELYSDGKFDEMEYNEWSKGKEFRLEAVKDSGGMVIGWKSVVRKAVDDDPVNVLSDKE